MDNSISSYIGVAKQKQIIIKNNILEEISVYADKFTIIVAINNVLYNAVKFTPKGGLVVISAKKINGETEIKIKDTGIGMKSEIIERFFLSQKIASTPGTEQEKGTGLGLILVKDFIEKNNGSLTIKSAPGKGTEFSFLLPGIKPS